MRYILSIFILLCTFLCCKKTGTDGPNTDGRLSRLYCNDPDAVNYNWNFPGTPDNSTCYYPTEVFAAAYLFDDSVYYEDGSTRLFVKRDTLYIHTLSKTQFAITGFCGPYDSLKLTADRFYRGQIDTTIENGQPLCRILDTVTGNIIQSISDSSLLKINFTVHSDTGINYHRGTATKL